MKLAIITDVHIGCRNDSSVFVKYSTDFFKKQFIPYLIENKIDTVINLGDLFDRRKFVNFHTLNVWRKEVLDEMQRLGIQHHIIIGNHDTYFKNTNEVNSVTELVRSYDNIKIYTQPQEIVFDDLPILFLPWINSENHDIALKSVEDTRSQICMGHLEVTGFEMFAGYINADKGLSPDVFRKFDLVFTGHFHHKSSRDNIHYLGSPYEIVWSDYNDQRGFHIFDTATRQFTFHQNQDKIFHKIHYNDTKETFETIVKKDFKHLRDKYVKVIVDSKTNPYWFDQFMDGLYKESPADVSIIEGHVDDAVSEESIDEAKDTLTFLTDYVNALSIEGEHKNKLVDTLKTLYIDAINLDVE